MRCKNQKDSQSSILSKANQSTTTSLVDKTLITIKTPPRWTSQQLQTQAHFIGVINKLIKEDPNSDQGWSNLSYVASQINQNHKNIKLNKYGYAKFSELVIALDKYDIRKKSNRIAIKLR